MRLQFPVVLPLLSALTTLGCFGELPGEGETGSAVAELQTVPAGVGCLRIVYRVPGATADTTRNLAVTPGAASSFDLGYLAPGAYAFRPSAYNVACGSVAASTVASWVGDATNATITAGYQTRVTLTLRPNVTTPGTVDFIQPVRAIYSGTNAAATYAVMQDGSVRAWGANNRAQLGDGSMTSTRVPRTISGLANVTQIVAASSYACAITSNGLACWGQFGGVLGDDLPGSSLVPRTNADIEPSSIASNGFTMCGEFGDAWQCWSNMTNLNTGPSYAAHGLIVTDLFAEIPVSESPVIQWMYAIDSNGNLSAREPLTGEYRHSLLERVTSVAAADVSYCAVVAGGDVYCDGPPNSWLLGRGPGGSTSSEPSMAAISQVNTIVAGFHHYCALRRDRTVWCWGDNHSGQLGADSNASDSSLPLPVPIADVVQITSGSGHTCALKSDGTVWCWGGNGSGQLGDGTNITRYAPVRVQL